MVANRQFFTQVFLALLLCCCFSIVFTQTTAANENDSVSAAASQDISASSARLTTTRTITATVSELVLSGTNSDTRDDEPIPTPTASGNGTELTVSAGDSSRSGEYKPTTTEPPHSVNTQPCNLYVEFCTRSYGNITYVGTHNSPFVRQNNAASNQRLDVIAQLNDGVRMRTWWPRPPPIPLLH